MGCLPSWADELMSGFNANLPNWHTARQGGPQTHTAAAQPLPEEEHAQAEEEEDAYTIHNCVSVYIYVYIHQLDSLCKYCVDLALCV